MKLSRFFGQVVHPKIKGKLVLCLFPRSASLKLALKMAANFRLGSTCGPQATASSGMELENAKEVDEFGRVKSSILGGNISTFTVTEVHVCSVSPLRFSRRHRKLWPWQTSAVPLRQEPPHPCKPLPLPFNQVWQGRNSLFSYENIMHTL